MKWPWILGVLKLSCFWQEPKKCTQFDPRVTAAVDTEDGMDDGESHAVHICGFHEDLMIEFAISTRMAMPLGQLGTRRERSFAVEIDIVVRCVFSVDLTFP